MEDNLHENESLNNDDHIKDMDSIRNSPNFFDLAVANFSRFDSNPCLFFSNYLDADQVPKIIDFLPNLNSKISFLEYCIYERKFEDESIHNSLFHLFLASLPQRTKTTLIKDDEESIKTKRMQFLRFLPFSGFLNSDHYNLIDKHYIDEKLYVFEKNKQYDEYVHLLIESSLPCNEMIYLMDNCKNKSIYTLVAKKLTEKPTLIELLNKRGEFMMVSDILTTIDGSIPIESLEPFLQTISTERIKEIVKIRNETQMNQLIDLDKQNTLQKLESGFVEIDSNTQCSVCLQPIGNDPFYLPQDNFIVHKHCL